MTNENDKDKGKVKKIADESHCRIIYITKYI